MDKLIQNFSIKSLSDFFKNNANLKPQQEDLAYIIEDKDFPDFSELTRIGNVVFKNSDELIVFSCKYNGILSERSSKKKQFEIAKLVLKEDFKDGAIFVFYDDAGKFRFSFIRRNWDGKADKKYSSWKRFTYFVSPEDTNKTFKQRIGNCTFKDLDSIQDAFSVEKLTKEFYNDLFKWYQWTLESEVGITFPNNTATSDDDRVKLEEQMIRLITRLLFVWFIKQKHLVPDDLFKKDKLSEILKDFSPDSFSNGNYYNAILQNLFFATLNKAVTEREFAKLVDKRDIKTRYRYAEMFTISEEEVLNLFRPIPFLNGGLFECLDKEESTDGVKYHLDGFSRSDKKSPNGNLKHRAFIPNVVFFGDDKNEGLIPLLERYNFTVEENVPNEVQVALDPELLGNVFENLLGAFNPETQESARKQSGSFYTPKEIVAYMVDESLIAYLNNASPDLEEELIRQIFEQENLPESLADDHDLCEKIANTLRAVKILDPACGSGAFPMGILNRMVEVLEKLDAKNKASHHDLKLHLIEECIYGVDIQTIAAQISKLRFFISLIVEQDAMDLSKPEENYGVLTLPNLETKFVAANTLIGMKKKKEGDFVNSLFTDPLIDETKHQLMEVRKEHFYAKSAYKKKELRDKDAQLRAQLSKLLQDNNEFAPEDAIQFSQWNPYDQNASSPFFDPEWMFGLSKENGGLNSADGGYFDIVIGNPPYVSAPSMVATNKNMRSTILESKTFSTLYQKWDLYIPFMELGLQLLSSKGVFSMIVPYPFTNQTYAKKLREFIISQYNLVNIVDLNGTKVFDNATVSNCIPIIKRSKSGDEFCFVSNINEQKEIKRVFKQSYSDLIQDDKTNVWNLTKEKRKINRYSEMNILGDYCYLSVGMVLNADEKKAKGEFSKDDLISETFDKIHCRKYIEAKDIKRYCVLNTRFLEYNTARVPEKLRRPTFRELYEQPKLMFNRLGNLQVYLDEDINFLHSDSMFSAVLWRDLKSVENKSISSSVKRYSRYTREQMQDFSEKIDLKYLLGILNSKYASVLLSNLRGGDYHIYPEHLRNLPIPIVKDKQEELITLVEKILNSKKQNPKSDTTEIENEIDKLVYELYGLTDEEIDVIENT